MKKVLISLVLLAGIVQSAHAEIFASLTNKNGGRIDIYDVAVPLGAADGCDGKYVAKAWGKGPDIYGCWSADDDLISVKWVGGDGSYRSYLISDFTLAKKTKPTKGSL
jgi:hypothetical protein